MKAKDIKVEHLVKDAAELLPHQPILENFIHHNPLRPLESLPFRVALEHVHELESYMSPGERLFALIDVDPRKRVNEALADLSSAFLDRGAAKWAPRFRDKGFLLFFASLECLGLAPWRRYAREVSKRILPTLEESVSKESHIALAESIIRENLDFFGSCGEEEEMVHTIRSMLLELRGWAGMFSRMESHPNEAPPNTLVLLIEFCAVQSILTRSSIESFALQFGWDPKEMPFHKWISKVPLKRPPSYDSTPHDSAIAYLDQNSERRESLETEFENALLRAIGMNENK